MYNKNDMVSFARKGLIFSAAALAVLLLLLLFPAAASAEQPASGDYMVKSGETLTLYSNDKSPKPLAQVPGTYYVTLSDPVPVLGYYKVSYGGRDYFVREADFAALSLHDEEKYGAVPAESKAYLFDKAELFPEGEYEFYYYDKENGDKWSSSRFSAQPEDITAVYGILALDGAIYYGVHIELTGMLSFASDCYIPAELASGSFAELTPSTIPENAFEQHKAEVDEELAQQQKPSGEGGSGSAETPDPEGTENNLERIILSVVIAVLCVAVVLLIFRPGHKKA